MDMTKETITQMETNIDHLTGEELGEALLNLNEMPIVLDAIFIQAMGKKNRPCGILQVLCKPENEQEVVSVIFRHTHTLGIRTFQVERYILPRRVDYLPTDKGSTKIKIYELDGQEYLRPEADELAKEAKRKNTGVPSLRFQTIARDEK